MLAIPKATRPPILVFAVCFLLSSCGFFFEQTEDAWFPHYSTYWVKDGKNPIVFVHGLGGEFETFRSVPLELAPLSDRGLLYFTYQSGPLQEHADHISRIAGELRSFLENNVFNIDPTAEVEIIAHSTGGLIARDYIVNNPFTHRVKHLVLVAVPNYGAYYAQLKQVLLQPWAHIWSGDFQVKELQFGSHSLFSLQRRWDCLYEFYMWQEKLRKNHKWFDVIVLEQLQKEKKLPACVYYNQMNHKEGLPQGATWVKFPKILVIIGTSEWEDSWTHRYSDGVVRLESGILDERFLFKPACRDESIKPAIFFVSSGHAGENGFFAEPHKKEVEEIIANFLDHSNETVCQNGRPNNNNKYIKGLDANIKKHKSKAGQANVAAFWIRVSDLVNRCREDLVAANTKVEFEFRNLTVDKPFWETIPQDWTVRKKMLWTKDSWIHYQRYIVVNDEGLIPEVAITITPDKETNDNQYQPILLPPHQLSLKRGRTTMVECVVSLKKCFEITGWESDKNDSQTQEKYPAGKYKESLKNFCEREGVFTKSQWTPGYFH